jgi:type II secretory pathway pseudopilin PulG
MRRLIEKVKTSMRAERPPRSESGDTLIEVLLAIVILGLASVALLLAFGTSISASAEHRSLTTFDTVLRTASEEAISQIQNQQPNSVFGTCPALNGTPALDPVNFSLPTGWSARVTSVQYWNATAPTPSFTGTCVVSTATAPTVNTPQLVTITITSPSNAVSPPFSFVVTDPQDRPVPQAGKTATQLVFLTSPGDSVAGAPFTFNPRVAVEDSNGNVITNDLSYPSLSITTGAGPSGAVLSSTCLPGTPDQGVYTYYGCDITTATNGNDYTLTASSNTLNLTSDPSTAFQVFPAAASTFTLSNPGTQTAGTAFNETITAYDTYGNVATGYTGSQAVTFSGPSNSPNGTAPSYPATVTFTAGVGTASITLVDGQNTTLTATQGLVTGTSGSFTVSPAAPSTYSLSNPGTQKVGTAFNETLKAYDGYGNVATGYTGAQAITFTGPSNSPTGTAPIYPATVTFTAGVGTASITLVDAQSTTLTATQGLATGTSASFTVGLASTSTFTVTSATSPTAGTPFNLTLTAADAYGNPTPTYTGIHTISWGGAMTSPSGLAPVYPTTLVSFTNGVSTTTLSVTLYAAGVNTLTAASILPSVSGSGSITVAPSAPVKLGFVPTTPGPGTAGSAIPNVAVAVEDTYGNVVTSASGGLVTATIHSGPQAGFSSGASQVAVTSGLATFPNLVLNAAGSYTLTAAPTGVSGVANPVTSSALTISPATASTFTLSNPGPQTAGTAFNEAITAYDAYGNVATGYTGSQAITFTGPFNSPSGTPPSYPSTVNFTAGVGSATGIKLYDVQTTTLTATQGTTTGISAAFAVSPATVSHFLVTTPATATAGTAASGITLSALDPYNNPTPSYSGNHTIAWSGAMTSPGGNAPAYPATTVSFTNGVSTTALSVTLYDAAANTLTASATSPTVSGSGTITVSPRAATGFTLANPGTQTAGTAFSETITAHDTYGNVATGYAGNQTIVFTGPSSSPNGTAPTYPGTVNFTMGVGIPSVTLVKAQSIGLTATQGTLTGASGIFTVTANSLGSFTVPTPSTQIAGTPFNETITATDAYGNVATGWTNVTGCVTFYGPQYSPTFPGAGTCGAGNSSLAFNASGQATASITILEAQSTSLGVISVTAPVGEIGSSGSFIVNPAFSITSVKYSGSNNKYTFSGTGASGSTSVTVTVCTVVTFPCPTSPNHVAGTAVTGSSPPAAWTTGIDTGALTAGAQYWAEATQGSATSAVFPFVPETVGPSPLNVTMTSSGTPGEASQGDTATITFSEPLDASTICSAWANNGLTQSVSDATVTLSNGGTNDGLSATSASCSSTGNFGSVATGGNYVSSNTTFVNSTITWNPTTYTLTFTLGTYSTGTRLTNVPNSTPKYTADSDMADLSGNSVSLTQVTGTSSRF